MMTNTQLATASLDDIVFDGRNRQYGAYELRALYQRHMTRALIIATAMCALLLVFPLVAAILTWRLRSPYFPLLPVLVLFVTGIAFSTRGQCSSSRTSTA